jgi:hypothetical protein
MKYFLAVIALAAMAFATGASAESVIPAATLTELTTDGTDTMTAIGGGMLSLGVVAVLFKWAKAALFG